MQVGDTIYNLDDIERVSLVYKSVSIKLTDDTVIVVLEAESERAARSYHSGFADIGFVVDDTGFDLINPFIVDRELKPKPIFD